MPRDSAVARAGIYVGKAWQQVQTQELPSGVLMALGNPLWRFERETQTALPALPCLICQRVLLFVHDQNGSVWFGGF